MLISLVVIAVLLVSHKRIGRWLDQILNGKRG